MSWCRLLTKECRVPSFQIFKGRKVIIPSLLFLLNDAKGHVFSRCRRGVIWENQISASFLTVF